MSIRIKSIRDTELCVFKCIKDRDQREREIFNEIIKCYQVLIKKLDDSKLKNDDLRTSLLSGFGATSDISSSVASSLKITKNDELRDIYKKLAESKESEVKLKERVINIENEKRILEKEAEKLRDENKKLTNEINGCKTVMSDLKEKLEIKTKEHSAVTAENSLLTDKIKEQNSDISLYHKTITDLQNKMIDKMNDAAQLYEEAKVMKQESILKKHSEFGISESGFNFGMDLSSLNDNYFNVPSRTRHKLFAHSKEAICLSYSSTGNGLATGGGDGSIKIWDVEQGKEIGSLTKQKRPISCLCFTPDDQFLATCSVDRNIKIWKIQTLREAISFSGHSDTINTCAFSYAAKCLVTGSSDRTIRLWDYSKGIAIKTFPCTSSCFTLDTLPTETDIVSGHLDGSLRFWCAKSEEKVHEMKEVHSDVISSVKLTRDGNYVLTNSRDHTLKLIDVRKYEEVCSFEHDLYVNGTNTNKATLNSKGNYGAVGSKQGNIIIFEIKGDSIQIEEIYQGFHSSCINGVEWQPCASSFSSIDSSGSLLIWE